MTFWRRTPAQVEVPAPRADAEPTPGPTEGELARQRAEEALVEEIERTEEVRAETPRIVGLGTRLGRIYETNHIREDVVSGLVGAIRGAR